MKIAKGLTFALLLVVLVFLAGCVTEEQTGTNQVNGTSGAGGRVSEKTVKVKSSQPYFTDENFSVLVMSPGKYKNSLIKITGQIFFIPQEKPWGHENDMVFQMYQGPASDSGLQISNPNIYVMFDPQKVKFVPKEDICVEVTGKFLDTETGINAMGAQITVFLVEAEKIESKDCLEVLYPPKRTVNLGKTVEKSGIKVTVEKVEFADQHTRVYVKIENNAGEDVTFSTMDTYLVQGKKKYDLDYSASFAVDVPEPDTEIPSGLVEEGWLFFEPVDPEKPVTLHMEFSYFAGWNLVQPEFDIQIS